MSAVLTQFYNENYEMTNFDFTCEECGVSGNALSCEHFSDAKLIHLRLGKEISFKELDENYKRLHNNSKVDGENGL